MSKKMTKAEASAEALVEDFELALPITPEVVCNLISHDSFPVEYMERSMKTDGVEGMAHGLSKGGAVIIINEKITNLNRKTFTGAHEIGHVVLHIQEGKKNGFECSSSDIWGASVFEQEANQFASSLLMPKSIIGDCVRQNELSWKLVQSIMKDCKTSLEATARRVVGLSEEACALIIHKDGKMWSPIKSKHFSSAKYYIPSRPLSNNLETSPDIPTDNFFDYLLECDSSDWGVSGKNLPDSILYCSVHNEKHDKTMTLMLIPDVEEPDEEYDVPSF